MPGWLFLYHPQGEVSLLVRQLLPGGPECCNCVRLRVLLSSGVKRAAGVQRRVLLPHPFVETSVSQWELLPAHVGGSHRLPRWLLLPCDVIGPVRVQLGDRLPRRLLVAERVFEFTILPGADGSDLPMRWILVVPQVLQGGPLLPAAQRRDRVRLRVLLPTRLVQPVSVRY